MAFFPPIPLIRKNHIVKKLKQNGATSPQTAMSLTQAGVINPNSFNRITKTLLKEGIIISVEENRYYTK